MKPLGFALIMSVIAGTAMADVSGVWRTERSEKGGFSDIYFYACGDKVCGKLKTAFRKDGSVNQQFPGVGSTIIQGMSSNDGVNYRGGTLKHVETGKTYLSKMKMSGNSLRISGCIAGGLLCKSVNLKKR